MKPIEEPNMLFHLLASSLMYTLWKSCSRKLFKDFVGYQPPANRLSGLVDQRDHDTSSIIFYLPAHKSSAGADNIRGTDIIDNQTLSCFSIILILMI